MPKNSKEKKSDKKKTENKKEKKIVTIKNPFQNLFKKIESHHVFQDIKKTIDLSHKIHVHAKKSKPAGKISLDKNDHNYFYVLEKRLGENIKYFNAFKTFLKYLAILFLIIFSFIFLLFLIFGRDLPDVSQLKNLNFAETTRIYDRNGNELYSIFDEENRQYVKLEEINPFVRNATIAIEDKSFYHHLGFDLFGIIRAQLKNVQEEGISQGASTITQQLAKNIFLSPERTYERKLKELLLSLEIEWYFSKDEIWKSTLIRSLTAQTPLGLRLRRKHFLRQAQKNFH